MLCLLYKENTVPFWAPAQKGFKFHAPFRTTGTKKATYNHISPLKVAGEFNFE